MHTFFCKICIFKKVAKLTTYADVPVLAAARVPVPTVRVSSLFNNLIAWTYPITEISNYLQWILPICLQLVFAHAFKIFSGKPGARTWADNFLTGYSSLWNLIITSQLHTYLSLLFLCYLLTCQIFLLKWFNWLMVSNLLPTLIILQSFVVSFLVLRFIFHYILHLLTLIVFFTFCPISRNVLW